MHRLALAALLALSILPLSGCLGGDGTARPDEPRAAAFVNPIPGPLDS